MKVAFLDPVCGISGDMFVACFLDAGLPLESLREGLGGLALGGYEISSKKVLKGSISATRFVVNVSEPQHEHRNLSSICSMIEASDLPPEVKSSSVATFSALAGAEGEVHGVPPEAVTFHEVGAVDSIVDIVAASVAMERMEVERLVVGPLPVGRGSVRTAHGRLPVPAPATAKLLRGFDIAFTGTEGELVTPTGAAILRARGEPVASAPALRLEAVGAGAGAADFEGMANIARVFIGVELDAPGSMRTVDVIETTIDDASPQLLAYVSNALLSEGAYEAFLTSVVMKKSRPGTLLTVLAPPAKTDALVEVVFRETPTLGVRVSKQVRRELRRRVETVATRFGDVPVKVSIDAAGRARGFPEYDACSAIAASRGLPFHDVWEETRRAWERSRAKE
jgi:uncharacterized protein (TIGR00299 family) protein